MRWSHIARRVARRPSARGLAVGVAVALAVVTGSSAATGRVGREERSSDDTRPIVVARIVAKRVELWTVDASTGRARKLTDGRRLGTAATPTWSPDGSQIAFVCKFGDDSAEAPAGLFGAIDLGVLGYHRNNGGEICVVPARGGKAAVLTATGGHAASPAWSPDGRLAYVVTEGGITVGGSKQRSKPGIYVTTVRGTAPGE